MSYTLVTLPEIQLIGIAHKTTNNNHKSAIDMPLFWKNYFDKHIEDTIPHKKKPLQRICVYTHYNPQGYSVIIGACVNDLKDVPENLTGLELPASKYAVFTIKGPVETEIPKAWQHIWAIADLPRAYTHDFELYEYDGDTLRDAKIYVSVI